MELHDSAVKEETGFTAVEMLLCLIIVILITFVGYYIYNSQKNTDDINKNISTAATATIPKTVKKTAPVTDETASWLLYTSPGKEYSLRLADGWKFTRYQAGTTINSNNDANLAPINGRKAVVEQIEGGKGGVDTGLSVFFATSLDQVHTTEYTAIVGFKTSGGLEVKAYKQTITTAPVAETSTVKGTVAYKYVIAKSDTKIIMLDYAFNPGEADYHAIVEQAIKTLTIN
jgi:hypothetical protein